MDADIFTKNQKTKESILTKISPHGSYLFFTHEIVPFVSQAMKINCVLLPFTLVKGERKLFPNSAKGGGIKQIV